MVINTIHAATCLEDEADLATLGVGNARKGHGVRSDFSVAETLIVFASGDASGWITCYIRIGGTLGVARPGKSNEIYEATALLEGGGDFGMKRG